MSTLKIELDTSDVLTVAIMGAALKTLAHERAVQNGETPPEHVEPEAPHVHAAAAEQTVTTAPVMTEQATETMTAIVSDTDDAATVEQITEAEQAAGNLAETDGAGIPWDKRIHSEAKTLNADKTWKLRRKPKDMSREQWDGYVAAVKAEQIAALSGGGAAEQVDDADAATIDAAAISATVTSMFPDSTPQLPDTPVTVQPPVITPPVTETVQPPVITPPVTETVQPPVTTPSAGKTFPDVMKFVTSNMAVLTAEVLSGILAPFGIASIALLSQRPDLIDSVMAVLEDTVVQAKAAQ